MYIERLALNILDLMGGMEVFKLSLTDSEKKSFSDFFLAVSQKIQPNWHDE